MILTPIALFVLYHAQAAPDPSREIRAIKFLRNREPTVVGGHQFNISNSYGHVLRQLRSELSMVKGWTFETYPARHQVSPLSRVAFFLKGRVEIRVQDMTDFDAGRPCTVITLKVNAP